MLRDKENAAMHAAIARAERAEAERDALRRDVRQYLKAFVHYHVNNGTDDACKQCGLDLRDPIHSFSAVAEAIAPAALREGREMNHDKQCEAMLMPPDANRAQLCHCRLREVAAERDALRDALRMWHSDEYIQLVIDAALRKEAP